MDYCFYKNKTVLITGHTGFKGTWLANILVILGANVIGYALKSNTTPNLFEISQVEKKITSIIGDIRDLDNLIKVINTYKPEIVFHLAAQPLVLESYNNPVYTYQTNVMGTVNLCETLRQSDCVKSFVNVTTDKVYENKEWDWGYRENEPLNGYDPYSNSKSCSELVTSSYINSFFKERKLPVSTMRAGNVIGGGDFSENRIIPDCLNATKNNTEILIRNPFSIRPYQFVLEPLFAYLLVAQKQYDDYTFADCYNIGPAESDCINTLKLVEIFCNIWGEGSNFKITENSFSKHESNFLKLDCSKLKAKLDWKPKYDIKESVKKTIEWHQAYYDNQDTLAIMENQINEFLQRRK